MRVSETLVRRPLQARGRCSANACIWRFARLAADLRGDLLRAALGAHEAGESRVAIRGTGSARGNHHAFAIAEMQQSAGDGPAMPLVVHGSCERDARADGRSGRKALVSGPLVRAALASRPLSTPSDTAPRPTRSGEQR